MRKHPVMSGLLLLIVLGFVFYLIFYRAGAQTGSVGAKRFSLNDKVGVLPIEGLITDSFKINQQIDEFAKDSSIVAVVVRINSPGGSVGAAQEIYDAILELKKKKKVVVSMGSIAASGGLLIACAGDKIVANPGTITGSISAIMQFANFEELMKKVGVKSSVVKSGPYKDIGSPMREMTPEEQAIVQELVDDIYNQFIDVIVRNRKLTREQVAAIADGRVFSGRKAKDYGLVDQLGNMDAAAKLASVLAGKDGQYELVFPKKTGRGIFDLMFESAANSLNQALREKSEFTRTGVSYLYQP
ncbi:MAG TPA: signal peptide peptidase SppA [Smithellaceae bacterium]|jgi:protease IV|nr:signal peptide peptidase SppA [Smithellaceae bacterium]